MTSTSGLAALICDDVFTRERQNAICKYIEESKDIEKCWSEIAVVRQTDLWWYCAIKYFSNFVGEVKCAKHILSLIKKPSYTYLGILLCKYINDSDLDQILKKFPHILSSVHVIKALLINEPSSKLLWLLRNNKCTKYEQIDLWEHAIMLDPIYALYAPSSVQTNPETLKIIHTRMYLRGRLSCLHEPFENVPIDILRAVVSIRTIDYCYVTSKELELIADSVSVIDEYTTDAFMRDESFIEKLNNGEVKLSEDLLWALSKPDKTNRYINSCLPSWRYTERIDSERFLLYPFTFRYLTMRDFNRLYKFFNNDEIAVARNNLAVLCTKRGCKKSMLAIYYKYFNTPIKEEYKRYAKYVVEYDIKKFANDKFAQSNPDICQRAVDFDKENIWHVRISENNFYGKFFKENPDMLYHDVRVNMYLGRIICKLGVSKLLIFNILNGSINIRDVYYHEYEVAHAACASADDKIKKIIVNYISRELGACGTRFYHDNIPHYLLRFEFGTCDNCTEVFNMIKANIDNLLFN